MTRRQIFLYMKSQYPLMDDERLMRTIYGLPEDVKMSDRYISSKEFRKLNIVTELLKERFKRKNIKWYCEENGWTLLIDEGDTLCHITLGSSEIETKTVTDIMNIIIGCL